MRIRKILSGLPPVCSVARTASDGCREQPAEIGQICADRTEEADLLHERIPAAAEHADTPGWRVNCF